MLSILTASGNKLLQSLMVVVVVGGMFGCPLQQGKKVRRVGGIMAGSLVDAVLDEGSSC